MTTSKVPIPARNRRLAYLVLVAILTMLATTDTIVAASVSRGHGDWPTVVDAFNRALEESGVVGGSIALVNGGKIIASTHYGYSDLTAGKRVDDNTLFHWASITKTLNAIAIMQLRDAGAVELDDSITDYVPELGEMHNPYGPMSDISLRMLLEHSAGFQGPTWPYRQGEPWEPFEPTRWEQLVAMMPYQKIHFRPGTRFGYSNPAWIYLARLLEEQTGDSWEAYIHKSIFAPLRMSESYFGYTPSHLREHRSKRYWIERGADGHRKVTEHDGEFDPGVTVPNGGWNAPIRDAAAYVAFLSGYLSEETQTPRDAVLLRSSLREMWEPRQPLPDTGPNSRRINEDYMGLGFFIVTGDTGRIIGHTGNQGGFSSLLYVNPESGTGVVAAFNTAIESDGTGAENYFQKIQRKVFEFLK